MISFNIELGDGDVAVGVTQLKISEGEMHYGLSFRDLVHPQEIVSNIKGKMTRNFIAITVKNKEALEVLKEAVLILERVMGGEKIEGIQTSLDGLNITEMIKKRIEEELGVEDVGPLYPLDRD